MEPKDYKVIKIEGEYATLQNIENEDTLFIAMALLPPETDIGSMLHYENFAYFMKNSL